ncbi:MAG: type II toxin-antitoxin system RelE/ParE family toxin [Flavobacteriales bacterium]|nr:type II toxin-antitoxin system RelE/ParE family toxin [Flavobacteriales bacterium]
MRKIIFYRTVSKDCPTEIFLNGLSGKQAQKVIWVMQLIEQMQILPQTYLKKLIHTDDIWEIRATFANDIFRILGFFNKENNFVTTHGFIKKTQKTPKKEIILAEKYKKDYLNRS